MVVLESRQASRKKIMVDPLLNSYRGLLTDEKRLAQAYRLKAACESEIAAGDTRYIYVELLELSNRCIEELS